MLSGMSSFIHRLALGTQLIEFSEPSYYKLPADDAYCNKPKMNKSECRRMWVVGTQLYRRQLDHPLQFRYEFDVTSQGLEFLRAFKKRTKRMTSLGSA